MYTVIICSDFLNYTENQQANGAIGGSDAATILSSVQGSLPTIDSTLTAIKNKKAAFAALPVGGVPTLVAKDLKALDTDTGRLSFALSSKTPVRALAYMLLA